MNRPLEENDIYFWFDPEEGLLEGLIEEEFHARMEEFRQKVLDWENVIVRNN